MKLQRSSYNNRVYSLYYTEGSKVYLHSYGLDNPCKKVINTGDKLYSFNIEFDENKLISNLSGIEEFLAGKENNRYSQGITIHKINKKGLEGLALTGSDTRLDNMYTDKQECIDEYNKILNEYKDKYKLKLLSFKDELYGSIDIIDKKLKEL